MAKKIIRLRARGLLRSLRTLYDEGSALPSFTVGEYRVAFAHVSGRLYATRRSTKPLGYITGSGIFRAVPGIKPFESASIRLLVENPLDVARGAAILLGFGAKCPVCGRVLDSKDRLLGIGPSCYAKGEFWRLETKQSALTKKRNRRK